MGYTFRPEGGGEVMPWKERSVMDERMRFVIRLKDGETMAALCREFGISRKTGYKKRWSALEDDFRTFLLTGTFSDSIFQQITA
jgi:Homeodomain-like domain-containing protein